MLLGISIANTNSKIPLPLALKQKIIPPKPLAVCCPLPFSQLQQMTPRAYVLIFFFWSLLTILTPTLIFLSENSKSSSVSLEFTDGENGGIQMSRKVVGLTRKYPMLKVLAEEQTAPAAIPTPNTAPSPSPSPSLAPAPSAAVPLRSFMAGAGKVILTTLKGLKEAY